MKLVEIARAMGVPEGTVRRWKSDQDWSGKKAAAKKKENERSETSNPNVRKKRGAPFGNKNGKGGPPGNIKPVTHGAYMKIYADVLSERERERLPLLVKQDNKDRLANLYATLQSTEIRLMGHINDIENGADAITHRTVSQADPNGDGDAVKLEITKVVEISKEQGKRKEQLRNFTDALTRVRAEMRKVADSIRQLDEDDPYQTLAANNTVSVSINNAPANPLDSLTEADMRKILAAAEEACAKDG
jgi:uncharacterized protein YjcR